jgi:hypothetical protein
MKLMKKTEDSIKEWTEDKLENTLNIQYKGYLENDSQTFKFRILNYIDFLLMEPEAGKFYLLNMKKENLE